MLLQDFYTLNNLDYIETGSYDAYISLNKNHAIFKGHFPGNPITPGVCMLQVFKNLLSEITQSELNLVSSTNIKFLAIINPESHPDLRLNMHITNDREMAVQVNCNAFIGDTLALKISAEYKKSEIFSEWNMNQKEDLHINYCVIIPTYNNDKTLRRVLDGVLQYTNHVLVVNDGATDSSDQIISEYDKIIYLKHPKNKGKGCALRTGFHKALEMGYEYAITIDSDGQHFPEDIPLFLDFVRKKPSTLLIGSRNMEQDGVPGKSSFGNKFSNFWFWVESGIKLVDTQSGFRLYPIRKMPKKWITRKFEFEIECIVRSAWSGIEVCNIPIQILYDANERVSHFRPFKDFTRISILRVFLVTIAIAYIKPRDFIRSFKKKSFKQFIHEDVLGSQDSIFIKSASLSMGVFFGIAPFWGFQTAVVLFLAVIFRLNKLLAFAASNISIPPMIPIIILASIKTGCLILNTPFQSDKFIKFESFGANIYEYLLGSFVLAFLVATVVGFGSYAFITLFSKQKA